VPSAVAAQRWVVGAGFLKYDRTERKLWMPDGRTCLYDTQGRLVSCTDALGNGLTLDYTTDPSRIFVTQILGPSQSRQIVLDLDASGQIVGMTFEGRQWLYEWSAGNMTRATLPEGLEWQFSYTGGSPEDLNVLASVTTPGGGQVTYGYIDKEYSYPTDQEPWLFTVRVLSTRTTSGPGGGTWQYDLSPGYNLSERWTPWTEIVTSSQTKLRWQNWVVSGGSQVMGGGSGFVTFTVESPGGQWLAREERDYVSRALVFYGSSDPRGPAVVSQVVQCGARPGLRAAARRDADLPGSGTRTTIRWRRGHTVAGTNGMSTATYGSTTAHFDYDAEAARVKKSVVGGLTSYYSRGPDGVLLTEWTNTGATATARDYLYIGPRILGVVTRTDLTAK
jgi:hypothetical protein